jgi:hypothetical protein
LIGRSCQFNQLTVSIPSISAYSGPFAPDFAPGFAPEWIHAAVTWILPVRPDCGLRITISTSRPSAFKKWIKRSTEIR